VARHGPVKPTEGPRLKLDPDHPAVALLRSEGHREKFAAYFAQLRAAELERLSQAPPDQVPIMQGRAAAFADLITLVSKVSK
jgi:hypothetical protein